MKNIFPSKTILVSHKSTNIRYNTVSKVKKAEKKSLPDRVKQKKSVVLKFNFGYCTEKECIINVYNSAKQRDEYMTLNLKYKEFILSLHKGSSFRLAK